MIDVTYANFETEVLQASQSVPVLVDFWAPWCGPCKSLGPVLEKVEADYGGRFKLVKINSDDEQQLAAAFGIRSIPTCVLMIGGQPVDGFMGALPAAQVCAFLDKHLPSPDTLQALAQADEATQLAQEGDTTAALAQLAEALAQAPDNNDLRFDYVQLLVSQGQLEEATAALAPALRLVPVPLRLEALHHWLQALLFVATDERGLWSAEQFDALVAQNKRDFDARFAKSRVLIAHGEWPAALDELLEIVMRDKNWADQAPRKTYVALLELMTPPKPKPDAAASNKSAGGIELSGKVALPEDPQAELVSRYRRKLSMALN